MSASPPPDGLIRNGIREARIEKGLSQAELGRRIGVDKIRMHMVETGQRPASSHELHALGIVLGRAWTTFYPHVQLTWPDAQGEHAPDTTRVKRHGPGSQTARVLELLRERGEQGLTPLEALDLVGSLRLGARVFELRRQGWPIVDIGFTTPSGARVARYVLRGERS